MDIREHSFQPLVRLALAAIPIASLMASPGHNVSSASADPPRVILDTDMGSDCDDAGALAVLHALADAGEVHILGVIFSSGKNRYGAGTCDAINTYYGRGDLPLGQYQGTDVGDPQDSYTQRIATDTKRFGHDIINDAPDLVEVYRSLLEAQPDHSVTICTVGHPHALVHLLRDPRGAELIHTKVDRWVAMGMGGWNFARMGMSAYCQELLSKWPQPFYLSPNGREIKTGHRLLPHTPESNPVREAYRLWGDGTSITNGRSSWDQVAVLLIARPELYRLERTGRVERAPDGHLIWNDAVDDPRHCLVRPRLSTAEMSGIIEELMARPPKAGAVPGQARLPGTRPEIDAAQYPSLQAAFDALPREGGLLSLPPGTFEIREPIMLTRGDVRVEGAGTATHIKNLNTNGRPALIVQHVEGRQVADENRLWRIMLSNFRITGNAGSGHGVEAVRIQEIFLQGLTVSHHGEHGILLDHCYEDPRISDCLITYNQASGLHLEGSHDIVVSANQFEENLDAVVCRDSFNLCMTGNNLDDHLRHGVVIENTYGSIVSANMIEECVGAAILLDRDCYGNTLAANVLAHNGQGIVLLDAHGCAVSANTFTINQADAIWIGPDSGRITVTGNNFSNSYIGDGQVKRGTNDLAAAGIRLTETRDVAIVGNLFGDVRPEAVVMDSPPSRRILFSDNLVTNPEEGE